MEEVLESIDEEDRQFVSDTINNSIKDKSDFNWIISHTKTCPQCKWNIQKNEGCNHMTCLRCQYQFCWICFGNWATHGVCKKNEANNIKQSKIINENINQIIKMQNN